MSQFCARQQAHPKRTDVRLYYYPTAAGCFWLVAEVHQRLLRGTSLPETIRLSKRTYAILWQNITIALGIKAVLFVLEVFGGATMWLGVFADTGASLLVVLNGLRLLKGAR